MIDLVAQGRAPGETWRRPLTPDQCVVLGRGLDAWEVAWERYLSHRHATLTPSAGKVRVERLPEARNPIVFQGREADRFDATLGECFVIGTTVFRLERGADSSAPDARQILQSHTVTAQELKQIAFRDAPHQIDVLNRLPAVISSAGDDPELFVQFVSMLLAGIRRADAIALVALEPPIKDGAVVVLHADRRRPGEGELRPSHRLIRQSVGGGGETVLHVWAAEAEGTAPSPFTLQGNFDWAFCTPVRGEACPGWGVYVTGRFGVSEMGTVLAPWQESDLGGDLKFAELAVAILASLRQVQLLQRKQAVLSHFFSPTVLRALAEAGPEGALRPREAEVTVLFCDLRGFSRKAEASALLPVLERVSKALGVMTHNILDRKGVIADFLGDAALGFWGWPLEQPDKVEMASRAALGIRAAFEAFATKPGHPLAEFRVGIGVATGPAVAGPIGTEAQAKVTVFGPIVNLASRLEGMTKLLRVPILLDEPTARAVREHLPPTLGRCRRLARVRPYGLATPVVVSELLPPAEESVLSDEHLVAYEQALDAFLAGEWEAAYESLHRVPPQDRGKDLLTGFILQHNHTPPAGWDGVIALESKA